MCRNLHTGSMPCGTYTIYARCAAARHHCLPRIDRLAAGVAPASGRVPCAIGCGGRRVAWWHGRACAGAACSGLLLLEVRLTIQHPLVCTLEAVGVKLAVALVAAQAICVERLGHTLCSLRRVDALSALSTHFACRWHESTLCPRPLRYVLGWWRRAGGSACVAGHAPCRRPLQHSRRRRRRRHSHP